MSCPGAAALFHAPGVAPDGPLCPAFRGSTVSWERDVTCPGCLDALAALPAGARSLALPPGFRFSSLRPAAGSA